MEPPAAVEQLDPAQLPPGFRAAGVACGLKGGGKTDLAVYQAAIGVHRVLLSSSNFTTSLTRQWGVGADIPIPGDYDGDGKTDIAVYRPSDGTHYILLSSTNFANYATHQWGISTDKPILGPTALLSH